MAHMIDSTAGKDAIAWTDQPPWHGLGQQMEEDASLEKWVIEAGLDWYAKKEQVKFTDTQEDGTTQDILVPNKFALYRSDTRMPLGIVSNDYNIVHPREIIEFYRDLVEGHGFKLRTAGSIRDGKQIWALAEVPVGVGSIGGSTDKVVLYLLLTTSYDLSLPTMARFTIVRVVCNNTMQMAIGDWRQAKDVIRIPHNQKFDADRVKVELQVGDAFDEWQRVANEMTKVKQSPGDCVEYFLKTYYGITSEHDEADTQKAEQLINRLGLILKNAPGQQLQSAEGTLWGAFQAVTYDVDHNPRSHTDDGRLNAAWFGRGRTLKDAAWKNAVKVLEAA